MAKYIKNITGESELFPMKQVLAYNEKDKGNVPEAIEKDEMIKKIYEPEYAKNPLRYKDYVLIFPGEQKETNLNHSDVGFEPRLKIITEDVKKKKGE